jgi:ankyrin repeat protein
MGDLDTLIANVKAGDLRRVQQLVAENFLLASQRLPTGETPLMSALYRGYHDIVKALIEAGADIDVFAAAALGRVDDLRRTVDDETVNSYAYDGWTPLHLAAFFGQVEAARLLVSAGADLAAVSHNGIANTPLHAAVAGKHEAVALFLIECGAAGAVADAGGYTPFEIARQNQLADVIHALRART